VRIFTRYILKEVLSHALIGAAVFTFVIFMRDVGRLLELVVRNSAPVPSVAEIFFLIMPTALTVTIPMGVLVGILIGLSRMAADSEVTAMRASGVSVRTFLKIVAIFGFAAWIIALFNTAVLAPRSTAALADLQKSMASSQISFEVQPRVFYEDFKNYVLYVEDVSTASGGALWKNVPCRHHHARRSQDHHRQRSRGEQRRRQHHSPSPHERRRAQQQHQQP
jgi:lipopolysaccharide export LptBFGC system permease protein LptF